MKIISPRGTKDIFGEDMRIWHKIENTVKSIADDFMLEEIRTPMFEHTELFLRGVGETTDIVQKEMYTFLDKGDRSITLRPEGTAGAARSYIENGMHNLPQPVKLYYFGPMFRYEKMQAGRQRQFHQFGIEIFGSPKPAADAEVISVAKELLERLGITDISLKINSLGCKECRSKYNEALKTFIGDNLSELCEDCRERFLKNPLRVLDCKEEKCKKILSDAPLMIDYLDDECRAHFEELQEILTAMEINFEVDPTIVRGLDYYTKTVFEFVSGEIGAQSTVCGGGRYDGLLEEVGGKPTPAAGFGLGIERLVLLLKAKGLDKGEEKKADIFIGSIGKAGSIKAQTLTLKLRKMGIAAECDTLGRSVKAQMKYADKLGVRFSVIIGDDEVLKGEASLKDMAEGTKKDVSFEDLYKQIVAVNAK